MWTRCAIAGLMTGLLLGASSALAFDETPAPPSPGADVAAPKTPMAKPMQLGTPNTPNDTAAERKGLKVFGYTVFPKLNFGLDVLYGEQAQQLEPQQAPPTAAEEKDDVTVLGKIKRLF